MLRIVLDTDVVIAGMRSPRGASAALLNAVYARMIQLMVSVPLALEYEAKCTMPLHYEAAGISQRDAQNFVDGIIALSTPVTQHFLWRPQLHDPGDEMVLETAINGRAIALVTFNVRHYGNIPKRFRIEVLQPKEAIWRIRK